MKIGIVGLCTSHPLKWVPIIRDMAEKGIIDAEITAVWDSGETRPEGFAGEFCSNYNIPLSFKKLENMVDEVDAVIIHTANWDRHIEQAKLFIDANKAVLIDKPVIGSFEDSNTLINWVDKGARITGGSSLRFAEELAEYNSRPLGDRGKIQTVFAGCGTDEFSYGIHAYSMLSGLMGTGIKSVQHVGTSGQKIVKISWNDGKLGFLSVGKAAKLPFHVTVVSTKDVRQFKIDPGGIYRALLENCLPYICSKTNIPPFSMKELLEPEYAAIAAKISWTNGGNEVMLANIEDYDVNYDGKSFADEYRNARINAQGG